MKKLLLILIAVGAMHPAAAQPFEKNITGLRAGLNLGTITLASDGVSIKTSSRTAYHIALSEQILLTEKHPLYLETGIGLSSRGGKIGGETLSPLYLQIPVLVNYRFDIRKIVAIQPFAGLYAGFGIAGKTKAYDEKVDFFGEESEFRRMDLGVRIGVGITRKHLYFGVSYDIGCMNMLKNEYEDTDLSFRNNCFSLSIGYNF